MSYSIVNAKLDFKPSEREGLTPVIGIEAYGEAISLGIFSIFVISSITPKPSGT